MALLRTDKFPISGHRVQKGMEESQASASPTTLIPESNLLLNDICLYSHCQSSQDEQSLVNLPLVMVFKL